MLSILKCFKNKIHHVYFTTSICRRYMKISEKMEILLKQSDKIPQSCELIYRHSTVTTLSLMYHSVNFMTFMTVSHFANMYYNGSFSDVIESNFQCFVIIFFTGFIFLMAQKIQHGFPIRIYYCSKNKKNKAIFIGKIPFTSEYYEFSSNSLIRAYKETKLPWHNLSFNINNRRIYLVEDNFISTYESKKT
ncbi:PREDICTED: uncharacterized protein LOC105361691 [Ceratosolen solmsi marchali]|uniref:Uncharacterized protein LOC105361691 n=1 Tax=Ceratosolen solmsi marchali TaxID=326594 RepID=A0AAJ6YFS5_9HYME|nr:PREDICTED: uncharacterized protein LOC105361691 [Ceratosolen solmsi marchali]